MRSTASGGLTRNALDDAVPRLLGVADFRPLSLGVGISFMVGSVQDSVLSSGAQQWADALKTAARLAFMTLLLWGLYRFVPNRFVPARQAFVGALITAFCLETARFLFAWYMGNFDGYRSIYGAFAAVPFSCCG